MRNLRLLTVVGSLACGFVSSAMAGNGTLSATMTPLGANVTYSIASPAMDTYIGYAFTLGNTGGNTINNIVVTVTARATDTAESVVLFNETQYLPSVCTKTAPNVFTCNVGQLKAGVAFPSFQVFYKAPVLVTNGTADDPNTDFVDLHMQVVYAEQFGGVPTSPPQNSVIDLDTAPTGSVTLGTSNPDRVKSGVPKSGASLYTGLIGGIPTSSNKSAMLALVPPLSGSQTSTTADLQVLRGSSDPLATNADADCISGAHFVECPTYSVTIPGTFSFLTTTYRIDASSLKMTPNKTLNSVTIQYLDGITNPIVTACPALNMPRGDGIPCINKQQCYKNNAQPASIAGDCEWELINTKNGLTKFF